MTFAILALDKKTGWIGCAAATGNLAVGRLGTTRGAECRGCCDTWL